MIRKIIEIDEALCDGCGECVTACHEGAIGMVDGKARLLRDDYCDGLGACLPVCHTDAIRFIEREADSYDDMAVKEAQRKGADNKLPCACPGADIRIINEIANNVEAPAAMSQGTSLRQWPVQIKLVPVNAPYLNGAHLLIAADCCGYAYGNFHADYMKNKITLIGCPKLDDGDYSEKLSEILKLNDIKSVTVVRMKVPCCGGIENAVKAALKKCDKMIPWQVVVITVDGQKLER